MAGWLEAQQGERGYKEGEIVRRARHRQRAFRRSGTGADGQAKEVRRTTDEGLAPHAVSEKTTKIGAKEEDKVLQEKGALGRREAGV